MIIITNIIYIISFLLFCHCIGFRILINETNLNNLDRTVFSIGIGLGVFITLISFMGYIGLLYGTIIKIIIFTISFIWLYLLITKNKKIVKLNLSYENYFLSLFFISIALLYLIVTLNPTLDGDSLYGYLTMAREHYLNNAVLENNYYYGSSFPQNGQLISTIGYMMGDQITAQLFTVWVMGLLCCLLIFLIGRNLGGLRTGIISIIIWYVNDSVAFINQSAKIDLAWAFFDLLGIYAFMKWYFSSNKIQKEYWIAISGFLIGFAFGIKQVSAFTMIMVSLIISTNSIFFEKTSYAKTITLLMLFIIPVSVSFHWVIRTYLLEGYLFYTGGVLQNNYGFLGFFKTVWEMSMLGNASSIEGPMGKSIGPIILCVLPSIFLYKNIDKRVWKILVFCLIMTIIWYNGVQRARHFFPTIGLLSIICGYLINKLIESKKKLGRIVLILILSCAGFNIAPWIYINFVSLDRFSYLKDTDTDLYLKRNIDKFYWYPNYKMTKTIRDSLPNDIKIAALSSGNSYYLQKFFFSASPFTISFTQSSQDINMIDFYFNLKNFGITHVFLNKYVIKKWELDECWLNNEVFIKKYLNEICYDSNQILYELE